MDEAAKKHRDELAKSFIGNYSLTTESGWTKYCDFKDGFDSGYAYQEERLKIAIEALEEIDGGFDTLHEKSYIAREALAKIRGEG